MSEEMDRLQAIEECKELALKILVRKLQKRGIEVPQELVDEAKKVARWYAVRNFV